MSRYQITGTLKVKQPLIKVSDKFRKQEFVLTHQFGEYPQYITFQLIQDKCDMLDDFKEGDKMNVYFSPTGREWIKDGVTKYFTTLQAWKIEKDDKPERGEYATEVELPDDESGGLPF